MLVILIVLSLYGIEAIRYQRQASLIADYRYRLFEMRDQLREIAVRDRDARRSWVFAYLDSTTAKAISLLPVLSVWRLFALASVYENDESYQTLSAHLERELTKPQLRELKAYEEALTGTVFAYLAKRHHTLHMTVQVIDLVISPARKVVEDMRKRSLDVAIKSPEMSTLPEHDPDFVGMTICPI